MEWKPRKKNGNLNEIKGIEKLRRRGLLIIVR